MKFLDDKLYYRIILLPEIDKVYYLLYKLNKNQSMQTK